MDLTSQNGNITMPFCLDVKKLLEENIMTDYMSVYDLNQDQINQLKQALWDQPGTQDEVCPELESWEEMPDELILDHYSDACFVDEDFWK